MEKKFENNTQLNKGMIKQFNHQHINKGIFNIVIISLALLLAIACVYGYFKDKDVYKLVYAAIFLIMIIATNTINNNIVNKRVDSTTINPNLTNKYSFYDSFFIVKSEEETKYFYKDIQKIKIDESLIYIYITKNQAFILDKKGFLNNNVDSFLQFISKAK